MNLKSGNHISQRLVILGTVLLHYVHLSRDMCPILLFFSSTVLLYEF